MAAINPKKGDIISFQFVHNGLIGNGKDQVKVEGDINYSMAKSIDPEIDTKHQALYPYFAESVQNVDDPKVYSYIGIINQDGQVEIIGIPWILASTFKYSESERAVIGVSRWQAKHKPAFDTFFQSLGLDWTLNTFRND